MANNTVGEKELKTSWPVVTGLDANSKHVGRVQNLVPEGSYGQKSLVLDRKRVGL